MNRRGGTGTELTVVVSCEHAGNRVPAAYIRLFESPEAREALESHRGWDPGSLEVGRVLAARFEIPLVAQEISRLLVECNRSLDHPQLFSEFSRGLTPAERVEVVERYWRDHRERVRERVHAAAADGAVLHVGVHTFTPLWEGRRRDTDIGLLYDPRRSTEVEIARAWRRALRDGAPEPWTVHLNRPYRGWTDGLTTTLRGELPEDRYAGIELEVSQGLVDPRGAVRPSEGAARLGTWVADALAGTLEVL